MKDSRTARIPTRRMPAERPMRIPEVKSWDGDPPAALETIPKTIPSRICNRIIV